MHKRNYLAIAIAAASGAAFAGSLGEGSATPVTPAYTAEGLAASDEVVVGTTAFILTTRPSTINAGSVFTVDYGRALVADGGGSFSGSDLALDVRTFLTGTYGGTTFATNGTLSFSGGSTGVLRYIINNDEAPKFASGYASLAVGLTSAVQLASPYVSTTGLTGVTVSAEFEDENGVVKETASGAILTTRGSQMAGGAITGNATIDVNSLKQAFTTGDAATITIAFDKDNFAAGATKITESTAATNGTVAITITGQDWSWLDSDATTAGIQPGTNVTGLNSVTVTSTTISGVMASATAETVAVTLTNGDEATIPVQSAITASAEIFYGKETGTGGSTSVNATGSAVWSLNGSSIDVYAVPNSASASVFMWLTNTGTGSVSLDASLFDGSQTCEMTDIGTSVAGTEFDLTAAISAAVTAQCPTYVASGNRVRYNVSANAPANTIRISAAYRVGTDRVNLVTSSEAGL